VKGAKTVRRLKVGGGGEGRTPSTEFDKTWECQWKKGTKGEREGVAGTRMRGGVTEGNYRKDLGRRRGTPLEKRSSETSCETCLQGRFRKNLDNRRPDGASNQKKNKKPHERKGKGKRSINNAASGTLGGTVRSEPIATSREVQRSGERVESRGSGGGSTKKKKSQSGCQRGAAMRILKEKRPGDAGRKGSSRCDEAYPLQLRSTEGKIGPTRLRAGGGPSGGKKTSDGKKKGTS